MFSKIYNRVFQKKKDPLAGLKKISPGALAKYRAHRGSPNKKSNSSSSTSREYFIIKNSPTMKSPDNKRKTKKNTPKNRSRSGFEMNLRTQRNFTKSEYENMKSMTEKNLSKTFLENKIEYAPVKNAKGEWYGSPSPKSKNKKTKKVKINQYVRVKEVTPRKGWAFV